MAEKIKVGIFWVCDQGEELEIIWDSEEYPKDWVSDFGDEFILYEKTHKSEWKKLSATFFVRFISCPFKKLVFLIMFFSSVTVRASITLDTRILSSSLSAMASNFFLSILHY